MTPAFALQPIGRQDLEGVFRRACKGNAELRIGVEHEKFATHADGHPGRFEGYVARLLDDLVNMGFAAVRDGEAIIELQRGPERITLEPGLQVEHSGPPLATATEAAVALRTHVAELGPLARARGLVLVGTGFRPWGTREEIPWLAKQRYAIMRRYLPTRGRLALDMMLRTATVQANFDYRDEADAMDRLRTAFAVSPIVTAMMASSPIVEGRPSGYQSYRAAVWLETDEDRCGVLPFVFEPDASFAKWVEWALDVPMFFVVRDGVYRDATHLTFRRFLAEGFGGIRAAASDWETHLSTLFSEVRLKTTIEVRGADAGPLDLVTALPALWRGLLDDPAARAQAFAIVARASWAERQAVRHEVPKTGLATPFLGRSLGDMGRDLCVIARAGLLNLPGGLADAALLAPLEEITATGRSVADRMLADFAEAGGDPVRLVRAWQI